MAGFFTVVQTSSNSGNGSTASGSFGSDTTIGNSIVVMVGSYGSPTAPIGFSTLVVNSTFNHSATAGIFFVAGSVAVSSGTPFSCSLAGSGSWIIQLMELSVAGDLSGYGQTGQTSSAINNTTGPVLNYYSDELLVGALVVDNTTATSFDPLTGGFDLISETILPNGFGCAFVIQEVSGLPAQYSTSSSPGKYGVLASIIRDNRVPVYSNPQILLAHL